MIKILFSLIVIMGFQSCSNGQKPLTNVPHQAVSSVNVALDTTWKDKVAKSDDEWKKVLTPKQYYILREQGTERPFTSEHYNNHEQGVFICAACKNPLFGSDAKFDSGTGWPSYFKPYSNKSINKSLDASLGMSRDEISCQRCDGHLGHVFDDGPAPTGLRYCIDGDALLFVKQEKLAKLVVAQGCFWCVEEIFEAVRGVKEVTSGYAGGKEANPTYKQVGSGSTGHAESVEILYDSLQVSYDDLLTVYFNAGDITQIDGQGNDIGRQYRSIIFYNNAIEQQKANDYIVKLNASGKYKSKIAVEVVPYVNFYTAENYHQDYVKINPDEPYVRAVSIPRYKKAIKLFPTLLKTK
jgi:peptide methionine sulfoxide reductase msrA/msrB